MTLDRKTITNFAVCFVLLFAGLSLPFPPFAWTYTRVFTAAGNLVAGGRYADSAVELVFAVPSRDEPSEKMPYGAWQSTLYVEKAATGQKLEVPIDLRTLGYLPLATFVALVLSTPVALRRRLRVLAIGSALLVPLTWMLIALPLAPFLGGSGPIRAFELPRWLATPMNIAYRALVAPPGMAYAVPALLFWGLLGLTRPGSSAPSAPANAGQRLGIATRPDPGPSRIGRIAGSRSR